MRTLAPAERRHFGEQQERLAEQYLCDRGLSPITRNFQCKLGEIDLIMRDAQTLVFVEVRYRKQARYGSAAESVTLRKQTRIWRCAEYYLLCNDLQNQLPCRFDVLAMSPEQGTGRVTYHWIKNAFDK